MNKQHQSKASFIMTELSIFLIQSLVFAMMLVFSSHFFQDSKTLERIVESKYNDYIYADFFYTLLAIIFVAGLVSLWLRILGSHHRYYQKLNLVLREVPTVFYVMGNSVGITAMLISIKQINQMQFFSQWFIEGLIIFIGYFLAGCTLAFLLNYPSRSPEEIRE